jgi:hypothetical protein
MRLVNQGTQVGTALNNTDNVENPSTPNPAVPIYNRDPVFVAANLINTIYAWAADWDTASVAIYVSPQLQNSQTPPEWFPLLNDAGEPIVLSGANSYVNFHCRWGALKGVVTNASANTTGLVVDLFWPGIG